MYDVIYIHKKTKKQKTISYHVKIVSEKRKKRWNKAVYMKEGNNKTHNKNKEKPLPDELDSFTSIIVSAIDDIRNIKCKYPDIDAIYRYVSKNVATNVERYFIETIVGDLVNKNIIFNKPTTQGLDSDFIVIAKKKLGSNVLYYWNFSVFCFFP